MPPKIEKNATVTILKFKRGKYTYIIPIELTPKAKSLKNFKSLLANIINQSGGLGNENEDGMDMDEDIEIPKSEFIDDDIEVPKSEFEDQPADKEQISVTEKQLNIATPKDMTSPYNNEWIQLDDDILEELSFKDYDILAFAIEDEAFNIVEAAYEE